ncbi:MAG: phosphonopyruvate decarboxylase [Halanaerobiales bacterium]
MIEPVFFYKNLINKGISFFTGVPDSLLKDFCAFIIDNIDQENNIIAANEGNAVALAAGYHLATNNIGLVYMQNSGIGNAINPLLSLVNDKVYNIPVLLLIGWRGEPGTNDACQHIKQGAVTLDLLEAIGIPYEILPKSPSEAKKTIIKAHNYMMASNAPYAIVVRNRTFTKYSFNSKDKDINEFELTRENAIEIVLSKLKDEILISTTGKSSREVFEIRQKLSHSHEKDFLVVGSMGHASQIALAIANKKPNKNVLCLDGDGSLIMHLGGLATIGFLKPNNFKHIIINNGSHDSVGGQPTVGFDIDICSIASASGYRYSYQVRSKNELTEKLNLLLKNEGPSLLEVQVRKGARKNLSRPSIGSIERKKLFMKYISDYM